MIHPPIPKINNSEKIPITNSKSNTKLNNEKPKYFQMTPVKINPFYESK